MPRGSKTHTTLVGAVGGIYSILGAGKDVLHTRLSSNAGHSGGRVGSRGDGGSDGRLGSGAGCGGHIGIGSATAGQHGHSKYQYQQKNADSFHMKPPENSDFKASISKQTAFKLGTFVEPESFYHIFIKK
jgi:hypothetical protein